MPPKRAVPTIEFATRADIQRLDDAITRLDSKVDTAINRIDGKIDAAINRVDDKFETLSRRLEQQIAETKSTNDLVFKLILQQLTDIRTIGDQRQTIADQRHEAIMAQFEKLLPTFRTLTVHHLRLATGWMSYLLGPYTAAGIESN
jgi:hypothetical protein